MSDILAELDWRGLISNCTDRDALAKRLTEGSITLYCGFDPTADSLHVGNLVPLLALKRFQDHGHRPIVLAGGATGMVGDPSGKSTERNLQTPEQVTRNIAAIQSQLTKFLNFDPSKNSALLVNNHDWTGQITFLEFLRDVGKYITVNWMMQKDSVRGRMENENPNRQTAGISFTEFSYMLLQGFDFYHLREMFNCELQVGATDQWGNITVGTELIRKKLNGATAWGLVFPLLTKADGSKYGKTASGTVWLDSKKTLPEEFYRFFLKTDDADVIKLLKVLTFLERDEISKLERDMAENPSGRAAQKVLAMEMTKRVHGEAIAQAVARGSEGLSIKSPFTNQSKETLDHFWAVSKQLQYDLYQIEQKPLVEVVALSGLAPSKNQARQLILAGGVRVNGEKETNPNLPITKSMFLYHYLFLQKGTSANVAIRVNVPPAGIHPGT